MESERQRIEKLQLAFAGWLPAPDNEPIETDDWHTPPELVQEIADFFGGQIDLDPCWSPLSFVRPKVAYSEARRAKRPDGCEDLKIWAIDGLVQPWTRTGVRNRYVNPPYSQPAPWIRRLAELHTLRGHDVAGDSIALVRIDTSTLWWQLAWDASAICWLRFRVPFVHPGRATRSQPRDHHALIYWGRHAQGFCEWFDFLGHCERPGQKHEPTADELCAQLVDLGHLRIVDGEFALVRESFADEDRREHKLLTIDGVPAETHPFLPTGPSGSSVDDLDVLDAVCEKHAIPECPVCADADTLVEPIPVTPTVHCTCPAPDCPKHTERDRGFR